MSYARNPTNEDKAVKANATNLRVHYKQCREVGHHLKGKKVVDALKYLERVTEFKSAVPFKRYTGGIGRHAQAKEFKVSGDKVAWPIKAAKAYIGLLNNLVANAESGDKGLDVDKLVIRHMQVNKAAA